jgi:hypothetical protein
MVSVNYNQHPNLYVTLVLMTLQVNGFHRYSLNSELTIMTLDSNKILSGIFKQYAYVSAVYKHSPANRKKLTNINDCPQKFK